MSATASVPLPVKLAGQQGLGLQGELPYHVPLHCVCVVTKHWMVPGMQQAPRRGGQRVVGQERPAPSQARPCARQSAWVVTMQMPASLLQQAPRGHGLGSQPAPANHLPLQAVLLVTTEHAPVGRQQAPVMVGQGLGLQVMLACQLPQQQASVVIVHPTASVGQPALVPAAVVVVPTLVHAVATQQAPMVGQFTAAHA